jgi:hypothetical protein
VFRLYSCNVERLAGALENVRGTKTCNGALEREITATFIEPEHDPLWSPPGRKTSTDGANHSPLTGAVRPSCFSDGFEAAAFARGWAAVDCRAATAPDSCG